ncbi:MAG: lipid-A-disaccharide synthase [Hyphomicrobiaceae bacterium]|nr:lipid-A-disaccharide synthase [Hyphomicrobiaceae bacterium]
MATEAPLRVFLLIGEESGDQLAGPLVDSLKAMLGDAVTFEGVAGPQLQARGITSLFPLSDTSVMGILPVIQRLPTLLKRIRQTGDAILASKPDIVVAIDSPDFTHRVARRVRQEAPEIPILAWVSPTVWAWRPGRAAKMRAYVDRLLAILPFEPEVHRRLGGPETHYVGHPLADRMDALAPAPGERRALADGPAKLLILPGSRTGEISRHMPILRDVLGELDALGMEVDVTLPAVSHLADALEAMTADWPQAVRVVRGEDEKRAAFRSAHAALAASGTVGLELAVAGVPTVIFYKLDPLARALRFLVKVWTISLPNYILERPVLREFLGEMARGDILARQMLLFLQETPERAALVASMQEVRARLTGDGEKAADRAARHVIETARSSKP